MRIISGLLQAIAIAVLVLGILLLVIDPRLRSLVKEDLSLLVPWAKSSEEGGATTSQQASQSQPASQPGKAKQEPPTVTANGYTIAPGCALWSVEGLDLYYSPADPATICVQPPDSPVQAGPSIASGAQTPPNCAVAPDSVVYCLTEGQLSADTLAAFFNQGELQTPRETGGGGG